MHPIFESYLVKTYHYKFTNWPEIIHTQEQALKGGLNCITLVHILYVDLFEITLPEKFRSIELFQNTSYFDNISDTGELKQGDLFFFGKASEALVLKNFMTQYDKMNNLLNLSELPHIHLGVFTGEYTKNNNPLIIHANAIDKKVSIWPLNKFRNYEKYSSILLAKRLKRNVSQIENN